MIESKHKTVGALDIYVARIDPVAKPRMTKKDCHRPAHKRYFAYKDKIRLWIKQDGIGFPYQGAHVIFRIPVTKSWPEKRKKFRIGTPHMGLMDGARAMDIDNLEKGLMDAFLKDDSCIWDIRGSKFWHSHGEIIIVNDHAAPQRARSLIDYADGL